MLRFSAGLSACFLLLTSAGCAKPTHDSLAKESIAKIKELSAALHDVTDENSSKAAVPRIDAIVADVNKLQEQIKALPKQSPEDEKALMAKYDKEMKEAQSSLMGEMMGLSMKPDLIKPIAESMKKMKQEK